MKVATSEMDAVAHESNSSFGELASQIRTSLIFVNEAMNRLLSEHERELAIANTALACQREENVTLLAELARLTGNLEGELKPNMQVEVDDVLQSEVSDKILFHTGQISDNMSYAKQPSETNVAQEAPDVTVPMPMKNLHSYLPAQQHKSPKADTPKKIPPSTCDGKHTTGTISTCTSEGSRHFPSLPHVTSSALEREIALLEEASPTQECSSSKTPSTTSVQSASWLLERECCTCDAIHSPKLDNAGSCLAADRVERCILDGTCRCVGVCCCLDKRRQIDTQFIRGSWATPLAPWFVAGFPRGLKSRQ